MGERSDSGWREDPRRGGASIHRQAVDTLFSLFESLCEGAIAVDTQARIVWINEKYRALLGIPDGQEVIGREVEEIIPRSLMRRVVTTGQPILLDLMQFGDRWFVVTRLPLRDESGAVTGAVGFVLFDRLDYLKPLVAKFEELQAALVHARRELDEQRRTKYTFSQFVGSSPGVLEVKRLARRVAQLDTTVLLIGETGTGKELLAQAIHAASPRARKPFVAVNVAAVPETLLEAEFFGVAPGAYTGAERKGRDGKFKIADGGTLFLDEIAEMPVAVQAKLLRVLQEQEIEPLGANRIIKVNVRIVAASSRDLRTLVDAGKFRSDLFYRLNVLPIVIPPLRERSEDLEALCEAILEQVSMRSGLPPLDIDAGAVEWLKRHPWPGNVRELYNVLERAAALADRPLLTRADFEAILPPLQQPPAEPSVPPRGLRPLAAAVAETERAAILAALARAKGKKAEAAKLLGISRSKLYDKLAALDLVSDSPT
jgi:transcriptional regulator with PAS, ATPase and Fis domain